MKEQSTKSKKRVIYYLLIAACVLILAAATILTVYFVTKGGDIVLDKPDDPVTPVDPVQPDDPEKPTGGEGTKYVCPVNAKYDQEYEAIYTNEEVGWFYRHYALDFSCDEGEQVCAMASGKVTEISLSKETGNYITIDHGEGLVSRYRFVEPTESLKVGDEVKVGDVIATVAKSYGSEAKAGTHLHFEVEENGKAVNPTVYIEAVLSEK